MTLEEQERAAYASGNTALADALARVIDLEKTDWHAGWHERARAALEGDE